MNKKHLTAVLLLSCPDRIGLVSRISHFIFERGGNIIDLDEHVDPDEHIFSIRVAWDMSQFTVPTSDLDDAFAPLAREFKARWSITFLEEKIKTAIFVSKYDHCLNEILWRHKMGEYPIDLSLIISNHPDLQPLAEHYKVPYHVFPLNKSNKSGQEQKELALLKEHGIDTVVLARYMQILSPEFVRHFPNKIINIHHSFLPAFVGSNPYKQAYQRGVKMIGATSHYVTDDLDQGPIIAQDIIHITHKDNLQDLILKGRDLERLVLARALHAHFEHRVWVQGRKTIVFE
ncbi:MAG: formyltetrahydrofolate deformylase [candidate division KSB1 bacterium]|nr:formyltetrahydrofolate deformylase [candidate division KSB1 bacterium]